MSDPTQRPAPRVGSPDAPRPRRTRVGSLVAALAVGVLGAVAWGAAPGGPTVVAATAPSRFLPIQPCRLLDTRDAGGPHVAAGATIDVAVADRCGVSGEAVVAALTLTAVDASGPGYLTAYPAGAELPTASALNYGRDETVGNLQLVQLGNDGAVSVFVRERTHLVVDVSGYFEVAPDGIATEGRFVPVVPHRLIDTRDRGRPDARTAVPVPPDVPRDAIAVAVTITTTATRGAGFFTAYAYGGDRPLAATLNADRPGQTRSAAAIVPVSEDGFEVYTRSGDHVIVDITGYFTGPSAAASSEGLFVGAVPTRLVDTRASRSSAGGPRLWDGGTREFDTVSITGDRVAAVAANVVVTNTEDRGHVVVYPSRTTRPHVSTVNYDAGGRTVASSSIVPTSERGISVFALEATHVVVDVTGWFTGSPVAASGPAPRNDPPPDRRVTIISDSAGAGMRWNGALGGLQGFHADARLESCRRLVMTSCRGREGYAPRTVVGEIDVLPPVGPEDILVIATGYNDMSDRFSHDFDVVVATARAKGFHHIAWVGYRTDVGYTLPTFHLRSNYAAMNQVIDAKIASGDYPEVRHWRLDDYTAGSVGWFHGDGVHERTLGSWGVADWISRHVRAFDDRPCAQPWWPGAPIDDPCPNPDLVRPSRGFPDIAGLYGLG